MEWREDWQTDDPAIDEEHRALYRMVRSLAAVVRNGGSQAIVWEAVDVLRERLLLHFSSEEAIAGQHDREAAKILREDHAGVLASLARLRQSATEGQDPKPALEEFLSTLTRHDREVDVPLFRLIDRREAC